MKKISIVIPKQLFSQLRQTYPDLGLGNHARFDGTQCSCEVSADEILDYGRLLVLKYGSEQIEFIVTRRDDPKFTSHESGRSGMQTYVPLKRCSTYFCSGVNNYAAS